MDPAYTNFGPMRWLTNHFAPTKQQKKAMLDQQFSHAIGQLNNKYSGKLTPQQLQKAQLDHHLTRTATNIAPGAGMSVAVGGQNPMMRAAGGTIRI